MGRELALLRPCAAVLSVPGLRWSVFTFVPGLRVGCLQWGKITGGGRLAPARQDRMRAGGREVQETVVLGIAPSRGND
jgi:hypothetical protein